MLREMSLKELGEYAGNHPEKIPIDVCHTVHGWRSFFLDSHEKSRLLILLCNLSTDGSEEYKNLRYVSRKTGIPVDAIDYCILHNEVLTVVPNTLQPLCF